MYFDRIYMSFPEFLSDPISCPPTFKRKQKPVEVVCLHSRVWGLPGV